MGEAVEIMHDRVEHDFRNHRPTILVGTIMDDLTEKFVTFAHELVDMLPPGREKSTALTKLEECSMHSKAALARHQEEAEARVGDKEAGL